MNNELTETSNLNVHAAPPAWFKYIFASVIIIALAYIGIHLTDDLTHVPPLNAISFLMLGLALVTALGFEFVNGFHDTANAVATVIYTNALPAPVAVVWSGFFNFLGVLTASGAVAYGIIALLPVELILHVNSAAGFAMVFALLLAAIIWNLGTWSLGIPASSSHTMIGSIIGVGLMNQIINSGATGVSGIDTEQVLKVVKALFFSPLIGFFFAALLFLVLKFFLKNKQAKLFDTPETNKPPPFFTRLMLIITCTGVSFAHGSNDGQKGMGLIMLILIGIVPLAYSLNKTMDPKDVQSFVNASEKTAFILSPQPSTMTNVEARQVLTTYIQKHEEDVKVIPAISVIARDLSQSVARYKSIDKVPDNATVNLRNDMYLSSASLKALDKKQKFEKLNTAQINVIKDYRGQLDKATQYIPTWVKVAVALALGLGTMVGWKRIVVTVGEKIGKTHLTYGQGVSAELVAMGTILAADKFGLPVSTTHVLNSAVAGTMSANKSGLQWSTVKSILMAWVLTLPCAMLLSAALFWILLKLF